MREEFNNNGHVLNINFTLKNSKFREKKTCALKMLQYIKIRGKEMEKIR